MFNKVYICLDSYNTDEIEEIKNYSFLSSSSSQEIFQYFYSKSNSYEENQTVMAYTTSLEYFLFYQHLLKLGYNSTHIETLITPSMFIYNDKLFIINNEKIEELFIDKVGFFSIRGIDWQHPFFFILKTLLKSKGGKALRNNDYSNMNTRGKFFALNCLFEKPKELLSNIIIPFNIKEKDYQIFVDFIKSNMGDSILIKKDFYSCGMGNFPIDLGNCDDFQYGKFKTSMQNHSNKVEAVYIVPIEKFTEEYRVYFVKGDNKVNIYSVKKKNININIDEVHKMDVFKYGGLYDWDYIPLEDFYGKYDDAYQWAIKYLQTLDYSFGNIEFGKNENGEFVFFEVNTMGSALPYKGEDTNSLISYYDNIYKYFTN